MCRLTGTELSCKKCTVEKRCSDCDLKEISAVIDIEDNFESQEHNEDIDINEMENIDFEDGFSKIEDYLYISAEDIVPGFIGWIQYGGKMLPGKVISRNKLKQTAFVKNFNADGLEKTKKLIDMKDLFTFGTEAQNEEILGGDDVLRGKFLKAKSEQGDIDEESWLFWY